METRTTSAVADRCRAVVSGDAVMEAWIRFAASQERQLDVARKGQRRAAAAGDDAAVAEFERHIAQAEARLAWKREEIERYELDAGYRAATRRAATMRPRPAAAEPVPTSPPRWIIEAAYVSTPQRWTWTPMVRRATRAVGRPRERRAVGARLTRAGPRSDDDPPSSRGDDGAAIARGIGRTVALFAISVAALEVSAVAIVLLLVSGGGR